MKQFLKEKLSTLYFFYQYLGHRIFILLGLNFVMVLLDSVGLAMFVPLLQVADKSNKSPTDDKFGQQVQHVFDTLHLPVNIYTMLGLIVLLFLLKAVFFFYASKYSGVNQQLFSKAIRTRLAEGVRDLAYKDFVSTDIGRMQNSLIGESLQVTTACNLYLSTIQNILFVFVYFVFACFLDWKFSILVLAGGTLTNFIFNRFYKRTQNLSRSITKNNHRYGAVVFEVITHFKYLKATGRNSLFFNRLAKELKTLINNNIAIVILSSRLNALREPLTIVIICAVIAIHVALFQSPISAIIIILMLFYRIMQKAVDIQTSWNNYLANTGAIENVRDFQAYLDTNKESFAGEKELAEIHSIELNNLNMYYGEFKALDGINLTIEKNQSVAFVGESGSGKTSLVNVLCTLLPYDSGSFCVNGTSIREYKNFEYKDKIGYIAQEPTVFNADIFENVTFWDERTPETMDKFRRVVEMSSLSKFLETLPEEENTLLGNNGINISGGQKQRISIARELYRNVELLIMDEATSALDSETESMIKESIDALQGKVTILSIAHRLSTIHHADMIYLMDKGQIVAHGNFEELKRESDYFKKLTELQGM